MNTQKPYIIIIGPAHPLRGGLATFNERLARAFMAQGFRVTIFTFSLQYPGFLFPGTTQYSTEPAPKDLDIRVRINSVNPLNWVKIGREIKNLHPDRILVRYWLPFMGPSLGTLLRQVKKNKKTRVICLADNIHPHEKRPGDTAFTRYFMKPVDAFITMSEKVLDDLRRLSDKPARYIPHPLYDSFGELIPQKEARKILGINENVTVFLFFGFIRAYKGLDILLEAFRHYLNRNGSNGSDVKLLVAGEFYEDRAPYDVLLKKLQLEEHVILHTDFIPDSKVSLYFSAADCVVQPYRHATQSGVTPLAYHFNVPVIVTRVGGLPALVPDGITGLHSEPDAESFSWAMQLFLDKGPAYFTPNIIAEKKKYSWENLVEGINTL